MKVNSVRRRWRTSCAATGMARPLTALGRPLKGGLLLGTSWFLFIVAFQALAQDNEPTVFWKRLEEKGIYERLWEASRLYENEDNAVIQALSLVGRYQGQDLERARRAGECRRLGESPLFRRCGSGSVPRLHGPGADEVQRRFRSHLRRPLRGVREMGARRGVLPECGTAGF